jgi:hypothetical protein
MSKEAIFTMKLEPALREEFMAEALAMHRPASQIVREMMREFVQRQRDARDYQIFLSQKVNSARQSMRAGQGRANEAVEAEFAARRAQALKADEA